MKPITATFVLVAADCPAAVAEVPAARGATISVPALQHDLLTAHPYRFTLADLIFETHARRLGLDPAEAAARAGAIRADLFARPHPCMRASALPKRYGWGVHHDDAGRIALVPVESPEYHRFASGQVAGVAVVPAMRNRKPS